MPALLLPMATLHRRSNETYSNAVSSTKGDRKKADAMAGTAASRGPDSHTYEGGKNVLASGQFRRQAPQIIKLLEQAFALAEELDYGDTGYLIERALNEARSQQLQLAGRPD
jgi:hypothetical protein